MHSCETGYLHPQYCASLSQHGKPLYLSNSGGWLIERPIAGTDMTDVMGCYPLFCCADWSGLAADIEVLDRQMVSLTMVADPFGDHSPQQLEQSFTIVKLFKEHFVVDLESEPATRISKHHRLEIRRSMKTVEVEHCPDATSLQAEWSGLYSGLIDRHQISGLAAFTPQALAQQLAVPGIAMFRACIADETVGIALWYLTGQCWYYHLAANSDLGYQHSASYALIARSLDHFAQQGYRWVDLGAGAGTTSDVRNHGLSRFKAGWATARKTAYLCGRILNPDAYQQLVKAKDKQTSNYFPAYREDEFA